MNEQLNSSQPDSQAPDLPTGATMPPGGTAPPKRAPGAMFLFWGVIFPLLVLGIEITTRMCASDFFDPISTFWHVLLVGLVPAGNFIVWRKARGDERFSVRTLRIANGIAMGVSFYYALIFLPLLPAAIMGLIFLVGFLPMAPLFAFWQGLRGYSYLKRLPSEPSGSRIPATAVGLLIFLAALTALESQATITRLAMRWAAGGDTQSERLWGLKVLRAVGSNELMLRSCYRRTGWAADPLSMLIARGEPISPEKAREIYYRATGVPFNSTPPPWPSKSGIRYFRPATFDAFQGEQVVGGKIEGLSLESSSIDGSVDAEAALAYLEWMLVFKNQSRFRQEARAVVALPPGAVVSRLTLWVAGEEREAVIAARGKVTEAYKAVVRQKRDPVLVTTKGPDRILVQCFPVEPHGKEMKVRIGITVPLVLESRTRADLRLPRLVERNFNLSEEKGRLVWLESKNRLVSRCKSLKEEHQPEKPYALRGTLPDSEMSSRRCLIEAQRNPDINKVWADDLKADSERIVVQSIEETDGFVPRRVVLVVDGSSSMAQHSGTIAEAISGLPNGVELAVLVASDEVVDLAGSSAPVSRDGLSRVAEGLSQARYSGGQDNVPALVRAWNLAAEAKESAIVWIHGPQPIVMEPVENLDQRFRRRGGGPRFYELEASPGPNRVVENLEHLKSIDSLCSGGDLKGDLERLFTQWRSPYKRLIALRTGVDRADLQTAAGLRKTSDHLARLWAYEQIMRQLTPRSASDHNDAVKLASLYRLVTPVTGAVVLETDADYARAGLTPPSPSKVPTIPEPTTWMLIIVAMAALTWMLAKRRLSCTPL